METSWIFAAALGAALMVGALPRAAAAEASPADMKSFGTAGKEKRVLGGGKEAELFRHDGRGCLTHMWFGGDWPGYERTRIRVYVDGEATASIDMELGMGHGVGFGEPAAPWGIARFGKTGHPSGYYNTFRIPFGKSVRVTAQLGAGVSEDPPFWWIVRGVENLPLVFSGVRLPDSARLKLYRREAYTAKPLEEFDLCAPKRAGMVYLTTIAARSSNLNFLEACVRAYVDGAREPMLLSSGLEDYFTGTYYFNRGRFYTPVAGLTHLDAADNTFSAYRLHEDDPIFFHKGLRLTCRCGEKMGDQTFGDPKETTYTTYAWIYEW